MDMDEAELQHLYAWIDEIPLSRPKRNIARDFSDGVMVAEMVHHFIPKLVELHNYSPASSSRQKRDNWNTLNLKVFKKLGLTVPENVVKGVIANRAGVVEVVLSNLRVKIEQYLQRRAGMDDSPPATGADWGELEPPRPSRKKPAPKGPSPSKPRGKANGGGNARHSPHRAPPAQSRADAALGSRFAEVLKGPSYDEIDDPAEALMQKDQSIMDYQETVEILQVKVRKLEQLVKLKDRRIEDLQRKVDRLEIQQMNG